jgi:tetratricopeptide (TPR) repeat protein/transglutaminase-like putative cysteine protease
MAGSLEHWPRIHRLIRNVLPPVMAALLASTAALAGTEPLYQPAPAWVQPAAIPTTPGLPPLVLFDNQQRYEGDRSWSYSDVVRRIANAEELGKQTSLTLPWVPDKGDLIIHRLEIIRAGQVIDLVAKGQKFAVLRREANLEQQMVTGVLTATLDVEGLQVGDMLRLSYSITGSDKALGGNVQGAGLLLPAPARLGFGRVMLSWPAGKAPRYQALQPGLTPQVSTVGGYEQVSYTLPVAKPAEIPGNAPGRFKRPPVVEVSSFATWADVARVMAPLYDTKGLIKPDSPLKAEIAAIMAASPDPLERTQRALQLVQDKVRYLAVTMNGGNYLPQSPDQTWSARYGDCKAKTLLLLALLHAMGIEAEAVLANIGQGDLVSVRLPSALAFNHVLVRAQVNGESLWLDGTSSGDRLADIRDTPPFFNVLPLRSAGADLMPLNMRPNGRPGLSVDVAVDESAAIDLDPVAEVKLVLTGRGAVQYNAAAGGLGPKETHDLIAKLIKNQLGNVDVGKVAATSNADDGSVTITASAVFDEQWDEDGERFTRVLDKLLARIDWNVDRGRPAWAQIPVMTDLPSGVAYNLTVKLPDNGKGITLDGTPDFDGTIRGEHLVRSASLAGGIARMTERMDSFGLEIPANAVAAEKDRLAKAKASAPRLIASRAARRYFDVEGKDPPGATQLKAAEAIYADLIALDPEEADSWHSRGRLRFNAGNFTGARDDYRKAVELAPTAQRHLNLSNALSKLGDSASALAQAQAGHDLDPANGRGIDTLANLLAEQGQLDAAVAMLDERIAVGGEDKEDYEIARAALIGEFGDLATALQAMDTLIQATPGNWRLYNARCYMKAQRKQQLESAIADCSKALELGGNAGVLDSRALAWAQLGQNDKALADADAALARDPDIRESRFLRAAVLARLGRASEGARDLVIARRLDPQIDRMFARYGIMMKK